METFDTILNWMVMHQVRLMQLSIYNQAQAQQDLDSTEEELKDIASAVAAYYAAVGGLRLDDRAGLQFVQDKVQQVMASRREGFVVAFNRIEVAMDQLKDYERQFHSAILQAAGRSVSVPQTIVGEPSIMGFYLGQWRQRLLANDVQRLGQGLNLGVRLGEPEAELRARLIGQSRYRGADGITATTRRDLDTLVRGATDAFADLARVQIDMESSFAGKEVFVAVLDTRTTETCRGLNSQIFGTGVGPRPPLHWGCRSIRVPLVGDAKPSIPGYSELLKRLSMRDQNEILGTRQATAFREGSLTIDSFREPAWRGMDLETMAKRESHVFEAAGMDTPFQ